jgi:hypothetical protein
MELTRRSTKRWRQENARMVRHRQICNQGRISMTLANKAKLLKACLVHTSGKLIGVLERRSSKLSAPDKVAFGEGSHPAPHQSRRVAAEVVRAQASLLFLRLFPVVAVPLPHTSSSNLWLGPLLTQVCDYTNYCDQVTFYLPRLTSASGPRGSHYSTRRSRAFRGDTI